jgi:hypothetical protein
VKPLAPGRIRCCVPFCGRTYKLLPGEDETYETICGKHWRLGDKWLRVKHARVMRMIKRGVQEPELSKAYYEAHRLWELVKVQAIERAMGVTG